MNESTIGAQAHRFCDDMANMMRGLGPSESVVDHFRNARIEMLKGIRQMIDERIERAKAQGQKGTSFGVD